jgi:hypothetical protein
MGTFSLGMDNRSLGTAWVLTPLLHHGNDFSAIPPSHPPSLGLFSAPYAMEVPQKKEKN